MSKYVRDAEMIKILILNNYYYPHMEGGAEFSIKILAEALAVKGYDVSVLSMDGQPKINFLHFETINGVKVYRSYSKSIYRRRVMKDKSHLCDKLFNGTNSIYNSKMNKELKLLIDHIEPDIIHTQNMVSMSYWVWRYANKKGIPIVHTLRDYWLLDPTTNLGQSSKLFDVIFRWYHRKMSNKYVNTVTSPSNRTLEIFQQFGYFHNSIKKMIVNSIEFNEVLLSECLKEKLNRNNQPVRFVFAGKVTENKGIKILIEAFIESGVDSTLSICGTGDLDDWITLKKFSRIIQLGKLAQKELFTEYRKADVLVVPSLWEEPFGRIVIEGAQYGLPTIGSNKGGIPEIISKTDYGDIFDVDKKEELIKLIKKYANREWLNKIYARGPQNLGDYSVEKQITGFSKIYDEALKREIEK